MVIQSTRSVTPPLADPINPAVSHNSINPAIESSLKNGSTKYLFSEHNNVCQNIPVKNYQNSHPKILNNDIDWLFHNLNFFLQNI